MRGHTNFNSVALLSVPCTVSQPTEIPGAVVFSVYMLYFDFRRVGVDKANQGLFNNR